MERLMGENVSFLAYHALREPRLLVDSELVVLVRLQDMFAETEAKQTNDGEVSRRAKRI